MGDETPILAAYWTVAGDALQASRGGTDYSSVGLRERIEAVAASGYRGIGLHWRDLDHWASRYTTAEVAGLLSVNGLDVVELEILTDWFVDGIARQRANLVLARMLSYAEKLPIRHVKVGSTTRPGDWGVEEIAEPFARLCSLFGEHGVTVALEPMAVAHVRAPRQAAAIIAASGAPNAGVLLDAWHFVRAGVQMAELAALAPELIASVELADGARIPVGGDLINDGCDHRRPCGEGEFPLVELVRQLFTIGYAGPISVENLSVANRRLPVRAQATTNLSGIRRVLIDARR